jgi:hypothetical protein
MHNWFELQTRDDKVGLRWKDVRAAKWRRISGAFEIDGLYKRPLAAEVESYKR